MLANSRLSKRVFQNKLDALLGGFAYEKRGFSSDIEELFGGLILRDGGPSQT